MSFMQADLWWYNMLWILQAEGPVYISSSRQLKHGSFHNCRSTTQGIIRYLVRVTLARGLQGLTEPPLTNHEMRLKIAIGPPDVPQAYEQLYFIYLTAI